MNDDFALVKSGVRPGDRVVLFPGESVVDGTPLTERGLATAGS